MTCDNDDDDGGRSWDVHRVHSLCNYRESSYFNEAVMQDEWVFTMENSMIFREFLCRDHNL